MTKKISENDCYNCRYIKEKDKQSKQKIPNSGGACEVYVAYQCKQHPKYNNLESFPFVTEMPCWEPV